MSALKDAVFTFSILHARESRNTEEPRISECPVLADCCRSGTPRDAGNSYHLYCKVTNFMCAVAVSDDRHEAVCSDMRSYRSDGG